LHQGNCWRLDKTPFTIFITLRASARWPATGAKSQVQRPSKTSLQFENQKEHTERQLGPAPEPSGSRESACQLARAGADSAHYPGAAACRCATASSAAAEAAAARHQPAPLATVRPAATSLCSCRTTSACTWCQSSAGTVRGRCRTWRGRCWLQSDRAGGAKSQHLPLQQHASVRARRHREPRAGTPGLARLGEWPDNAACTGSRGRHLTHRCLCVSLCGEGAARSCFALAKAACDAALCVCSPTSDCRFGCNNFEC
jgi:hypothetical protein